MAREKGSVTCRDEGRMEPMKIQNTSILTVLSATAIALTLTAGAFAQTETIIHTFSGGDDGGFPEGELVLDKNGNLYGTTVNGGANSSGAVVEFTSSGGTWTEQIIYSFAALGTGDGFGPYGPVAFDSKGNLFGTTFAGGTFNYGTVFELMPGAHNTWTEKVVYSFTNGKGYIPFSGGVVIDGAGNVYGSAPVHGSFGFGSIFELVAGASGTWTEKVLHTFTGNNDGTAPTGRLVLDSAGNLFGVSSSGGSHDYGVVFELIPGAGGKWTEKVIYAFLGGAGGVSPLGGLTFDSEGNLYGVADDLAFELKPNSNGSWTAKTLHTFTGGSDGAIAESFLSFDKLGNLYGTTYTGGKHRGTVYKLTPSSTGVWTETVLHRFSANGIDGMFPYFGVTVDANGNVYGITTVGGTANQGVVYEIEP